MPFQTFYFIGFIQKRNCQGIHLITPAKSFERRRLESVFQHIWNVEIVVNSELRVINDKTLSIQLNKVFFFFNSIFSYNYKKRQKCFMLNYIKGIRSRYSLPLYIKNDLIIVDIVFKARVRLIKKM